MYNRHHLAINKPGTRGARKEHRAREAPDGENRWFTAKIESTVPADLTLKEAAAADRKEERDFQKRLFRG